MNRINQMLLEMAGGNFFYRLERSNKNDNIEALVVVLNMLAEEIQESLIHQGCVNSKGTTRHIIQMCFMLDSGGFIRMVNQKTSTILSTLYTDIIDKPFETFLEDSSKSKWKKIWKVLQQKKIYDTSMHLTFVTKEKLFIPNDCYITTFKSGTNKQRKTLITVVHYSKGHLELEKDLKHSVVEFRNKQKSISKLTIKGKSRSKLRLSCEDIRKLREGHDIIINNLEQELPSLKEFALQLGTNEFKLKYGFRELYGTSVYRFQNVERLRKAKMLIQYSDMPLKQIAFKTGFKSNPHFSRSFKKRYTFAPSELRKKSLLEIK